MREVLLYPDPRLRQKSLLVADFAAVQPLIAELQALMDASGHSVGIAAPQIGELWRVIVIDCHKHVKKSLGRRVLINPELVSSEGLYSMREGCMSLPDYVGNVTRPRRIVVRAYNEAGEAFEVQASKFEAIVIQHEMDHLDGILFIDRVHSLKTDLLRRADLLRKRSEASEATEQE